MSLLVRFAVMRERCGTRLDQPATMTFPADDAARAFTDLRVISALLCVSWPRGGAPPDARFPRSA